MVLLAALILVCLGLLIWVIRAGLEDVDERERLP